MHLFRYFYAKFYTVEKNERFIEFVANDNFAYL